MYAVCNFLIVYVTLNITCFKSHFSFLKQLCLTIELFCHTLVSIFLRFLSVILLTLRSENDHLKEFLSLNVSKQFLCQL